MTARSWAVARTLLGLVAFGYAVTGVWALVAPRSFYDSFPGGGRTWVSVDGPFNEHLLRDFGALNLALVLVLGVAAWRGGYTLVRTAAGAAIVWSLPHFTYHLTHLDAFDAASDKIANLVSLGLSVVAPVVVLALARGRTSTASS